MPALDDLDESGKQATFAAEIGGQRGPVFEARFRRAVWDVDRRHESATGRQRFGQSTAPHL
jgi:hypothetical protein